VVEANDFALIGRTVKGRALLPYCETSRSAALPKMPYAPPKNRMTLAQSVINIGSWEVDLKAPERARCSSKC